MHPSPRHSYRRGCRFAAVCGVRAGNLYNALNGSAIESYNEAFIAGGAWLTPTGILTARFAKITAQFDF